MTGPFVEFLDFIVGIIDSFGWPHWITVGQYGLHTLSIIIGFIVGWILG